MNQDTTARGPKTIIGRWENRSGKRFIELYEQLRGGRTGYGYDSHLGSYWLGGISMRRAIECVEQDRNLSIDHLTQIPVALAAAA